MGSLFKSSSSAVMDPTAQQAWAIASPTQQYVNTAGTQFTQDVMANPAYTGQRVANLNPFQTGSANTLGQFSADNSGVANTFTGAGMGNLSAGQNFGNNAQNIFSQYSGVDPTQSIINNAGLYANNPYMNGMIDAANRDVARSLTEQQLPGIDRAASGTGNLNSTRAGVESAIAQRGAMDRMADTASQLRGQFFGKGLDMSQNQFNQNLVNSLAANNQLLNAGQLGSSLLGQGQQYAGNNFNLGQAAGGVFQNQNQNELNANKAVFDESLANRLAALQGLSGIAANTQGKSVAGINTTPSLASQLGGGLLGAASAWKVFG